jgi:Tfp pilus assembly protein PilO
VKLKRKQLFACLGFVALGVVVGLAGLLLAVLPQQAKASKLDKEILAAQVRFASLHASGTRGPAIRAADLFQLARAMPDQQDVPGVLLDLARAAQASSVKLVSILPAATVAQADGSQAVPMKVVVDGNWSGITSFLRRLRLDVRATQRGHISVVGRLFVIDSVQISAGSSTSEVEATMNVNAFVYGEAPPPAPAGTDTTGTSTTTTTSTTPPASGAAAPAPASGSSG